MSFSLSFELDQGLQHGYYELIDSIKKALSSFQPQKASIAKNPLIAGDIHSYPSSQLQRASPAETPLTTGDVHYYPSTQPQRASVAENPLIAWIFTLIHHTCYRGPQQQKTLIFTIIYHSSHKRTSTAKNLFTAGDICYYLSFQPQKDLSSRNSSYRWAYSSLQQERASSEKKKNNNNKIKNKK